MVFFILAAITLLGMVGCAQPFNQPVEAAVAQSNKPRETAPAASPADMGTLVSGNSAFAFNLYQALRSANGNLFYSPYSISEALAMTYGGARGDTEKQMAAVLQFQLAQAQLHPAFNSLDLQLAQRGQGARGADGKGFRLHVVNAIWGQQGFSFLPDYLDLLAQNYGAGLRLLDFIKSSDPSRQKINDWVSEQTEEKIKDLLPPGSINSATRLVLTNAIYFNAAWQSQFKPESTADGQFHLLAGGDVAVRMMKQTASFGYAKGSNYQAVELPYDGNELSMVILLPQTDQFKVFEGALSSQQVNDIIKSIKYQQVVLTMPKFKIESQFGLKDTLSSMGMKAAFVGADFSGMDGRKDLEVSDVVHKAFVAVDENGTEAAAATAVIMRLTAMPAEPVQVTIDHPFIFFIRDLKTGAILFIGRVMNPVT
jgi:serpin B